MRYLILENDPQIDERISAFIKSKHLHDLDSVDEIVNLRNVDITNNELDKFDWADVYIFSTTFNNKEQIRGILDIINKRDKPKDIFISYLPDRLYIGLKDISDQYSDHIRIFRESGHSIHEIVYETKQGNNENNFFKDIRYFFDLIPYYWNSNYEMFIPERPICIYEDNNLYDVFKYKPKWILR